MPTEPIVQPPRVAVWLVDQFAPYEQGETIRGDLLEEFSDIAAASGIAAARRWYWRQSIKTVAHLIGDGLRVKLWLIAVSTVGACLLGWYLLVLTDKTVSAVLDRYHVYDHVSPYVFWLGWGILLERLINPMLMGGMAALANKGRELLGAIIVSLILATWSGGDLAYQIVWNLPARFPSWYKSAHLLLPQFVTTFISPVMIVVGGIIVRKIRSKRLRLDTATS